MHQTVCSFVAPFSAVVAPPLELFALRLLFALSFALAFPFPSLLLPLPSPLFSTAGWIAWPQSCSLRTRVVQHAPAVSKLRDRFHHQRPSPSELFVFLGQPTDGDWVSQCLRTIHSREYRRCHDSDVRLEDNFESVPFLRVSAVRTMFSQQSTRAAPASAAIQPDHRQLFSCARTRKSDQSNSSATICDEMN